MNAAGSASAIAVLSTRRRYSHASTPPLKLHRRSALFIQSNHFEATTSCPPNAATEGKPQLASPPHLRQLCPSPLKIVATRRRLDGS